MLKHFHYLKYLIRHKYFVFMVGYKLKVPIIRLLLHDLSKILPDEWIPYANYFHGGQKATYNGFYNPNDGTLDFNRAWLKHQHRNSHHWQHWVMVQTGQALPMPYFDMLEMVADWIGAGLAQNNKNGNIVEWYQTNKNSIILHPDTRQDVEILLDIWVKHGDKL